MEEILKTVAQSQDKMHGFLKELHEGEGLTREAYIRFLSMQYHLTKDVQKHFFTVMGHPDFATKKALREFLFHFAMEEEPHYLIAKKDLEQLDSQPLPITLDVRLWKAYFDRIVIEKPFCRLGATCVLENISGSKNTGIITDLMARANYLTPKNSRFLVIHRHEALPHGDQILAIIEKSKLNEEQMSDLLAGAEEGAIQYLRMFSWVVRGETSI